MVTRSLGETASGHTRVPRPFPTHGVTGSPSHDGVQRRSYGTTTVCVTLFVWPFVSVTVSVTVRVLVCQ